MRNETKRRRDEVRGIESTMHQRPKIHFGVRSAQLSLVYAQQQLRKHMKTVKGVKVLKDFVLVSFVVVASKSADDCRKEEKKGRRWQRQRNSCFMTSFTRHISFVRLKGSNQRKVTEKSKTNRLDTTAAVFAVLTKRFLIFFFFLLVALLRFALQCV